MAPVNVQRGMNKGAIIRMMTRNRALTSLVSVTVGALAFAGPAGASTSVSVTAGKPTEYKFALSKSSVKAGTVVFSVTNRGRIPHDFKIGGRTTPMLKKGRSATLTVKLKKGSVAYLCTVSGHAAAGMKGVLRVT